MKKVVLLGSILLLLMGGVANAATWTIAFDPKGPLVGNVFGFQADYALSSGELLGDDDLKVSYNKRFVAGVEDAEGAVPGTDFSALGLDPQTDWDISVSNNAGTGGSNAIVGFTLGADPLEKKGPILTLELDDGILLDLSLWVLSDALGNPDTFEEGRNFGVPFDEASLTYTIVPIPSALLLLGSGLFGLVALRRKKRS